MASSTLQKLLRSQSQPAARILTIHLRQPHPPPPPLLSQIPKPTDDEPSLSSPNHPTTDSSKNPDRYFCSSFYPSFSFGFFLNPISPSPSIHPEPSDDENTPDDDSSVVRADSVKKKRKKKMNKHKLGKLRKRLRRKT